MKRVLATATASSLLLLSTSALADNLSGFYAGASVALAETVALSVEDNAESDNPGESNTFSASDQFGSVDVKVGFNKVLDNNLFVGIEGNYNLSGIDENVVDEPSNNNVVDFSKESLYGIHGKIGSAVAEDIALYGILGYQTTELKIKARDEDGSPVSKENDHSGVVYGIGATYTFMPNVLLTAEATQTDFDEATYFGNSDAEADNTQFSIGLAYRFDI